MGASWGARGKMSIEVVSSDGGSSIQVSFELVSGKMETVGSGLLVCLIGIFNAFLLPIVGAVTSPIFLSWLDIHTAKDQLISELKQLFQNRTSTRNIN